MMMNFRLMYWQLEGMKIVLPRIVIKVVKNANIDSKKIIPVNELTLRT